MQVGGISSYGIRSWSILAKIWLMPHSTMELVERDPWGTQICGQSNLVTPNLDFLKKMEKWGMGLGMF